MHHFYTFSHISADHSWYRVYVSEIKFCGIEQHMASFWLHCEGIQEIKLISYMFGRDFSVAEILSFV